jgi:uncharacterized NAD(P)/FAD-binding protein YdhS
MSGHLMICIIGGGLTGAAAAVACLKRLKQPFRLAIVEPSSTLGRGVAFGSYHSLHLLNIRTRDLSIHVDRPNEFLTWVFRQLDQGENDPGLLEGLAHTFLPRQLFGEYVRQRLLDEVARRQDVTFDVVGGVATACHRHEGRFHIKLDRQGPLSADIVILATAYGLQRPSSNGLLAPYDQLAAKQFACAQSIALVGSGLTMVDVLLSARHAGFLGTATVISRRGQLPRAHAAKGVVPQQVALPQSKRMSRLTGAVRIACEAAEAHHTPWQAIVNGIRPSIQEIWQRLPLGEQVRFLRHVRPYWDAHRHRLPRGVHDHVQSEFATGRAVLLRGRLSDVARGSDGFNLAVRKRGSNLVQGFRVDLAFDCSGHKPDVGSPLIKSLIGQGLVRPDAHGLGLAARLNGRVIGRYDTTPALFALGPLSQGSLWEITAVPEIVQQADAAARAIAFWQQLTEGQASHAIE